jgi:serine protease AprX
MPDERLLIKVILPKQGKEKKNPGGGGEITPFKTVTPALRQSLTQQLLAARAEVEPLKDTTGVMPLKIMLIDKALAKSHVPDVLFSDTTCPIIGVGRPCEMFVQGNSRGMDRIKEKLAAGSSKEVLKAISTLKKIEPVTPKDRLNGATHQSVYDAAPEGKGGKKRIKVSLFDYLGQTSQKAKLDHFLALTSELHMEASRLGSSSNRDTFVVSCRDAEQVRQLSRILSVKSIKPLPIFRLISHRTQKQTTPLADLPMPGAAVHEFPVVAVVDSGIAPIHALTPWIYGRESFVADAEADTYHGSFVGSLLVWGDKLNPGLAGVDATPCRLLDVHVLPNTDPRKGSTGTLTEQEFLVSLEQCLRRHSNEVKVWNLSLGTNELCDMDRFSELAIELDDLQERYGVNFVIAAGNYEDSPLAPYPRDDSQKGKSRITAPADSVLGITVASLSHLDHPTTGTQTGEPSPFSRNGPGPSHIIKPDLAHCGGNIALNGRQMLGVTSIADDGSLVDDVGTSYAAPLISRQLAHLHHTITPNPSPTLARALLTHNARDVRTRGRVKDGDDIYVGFGTPLDIPSALECEPWKMTLVFEETLRPGYFLEWDDFPFPASLRQGNRYTGEIWMTLAYPPHRNHQYGSEYCETHIDASFGVYTEKEGKEKFDGQVPLEHQHPGQLWESFQVKKLRKWAPVRTYHRLLSTRGIAGLRWRLFVKMITRHDIEDRTEGLSQPFS